MIHNPDRKPQTPNKATLVRTESNWEDGSGHYPGSVLRGSRPEYIREPKTPPPLPKDALPIVE